MLGKEHIVQTLEQKLQKYSKELRRKVNEKQRFKAPDQLYSNI